jgi:hypothetical protein
LIIDLPQIKSGISGGGAGRRVTRRVAPFVRAAVGIGSEAVRAGLSYDLIGKILGTFPTLAQSVIQVVDYSPMLDAAFPGVRSPLLLDPKGGYLPTDVVHARIAEGYVVRAYRSGEKPQGEGSLAYIPVPQWGADPYAERAKDPTGVEWISFDKRPVYYGEFDPLGLYLPSARQPEAIPFLDEHLEIINGEWIVRRIPDPHPLDKLHMLAAGVFAGDEPKLPDEIEVIGRIVPGSHVVRIEEDSQADERRALFERENFGSKLDINLTLPVRKMKRRALGLEVEQTV